MNDMGLAFMSLVLVFVCLLVNTGSLLLTYAGLFEIVMSFPMAMALWAVCGQSQYGIMEMLGFILILCIGADDVFVFCDTWKESQCVLTYPTGDHASCQLSRSPARCVC